MKKSKLLKKLVVRDLFAPDMYKGFLTTLEALSVVDLDPEKDDLGEIYRRRLRAGIKTYAALLEEEVIGTASLFVEPKFLHSGGFVAHVEDVAVRPDYQGKGVGAAIMLHVEREAREAKCYKIILDCSDKNREFYERLGYRRCENEMRKDL
jgi:glucosamine-phosphate N-acetyltransferase